MNRTYIFESKNELFNAGKFSEYIIYKLRIVVHVDSVTIYAGLTTSQYEKIPTKPRHVRGLFKTKSIGLTNDIHIYLYLAYAPVSFLYQHSSRHLDSKN